MNQNQKKKKVKTRQKTTKTKTENGKFPGSGSPSRLGPHSRYNALPTELRGTCHERKANLKIKCKKYVLQGTSEQRF